MQRYSVPEAGHLGAAIWARLFGHDRFGAHFMGAGSFGRWERLGAAVLTLCRVIAVNI